jgi:hypothetical protein
MGEIPWQKPFEQGIDLSQMKDWNEKQVLLRVGTSGREEGKWRG